jgi:hypothetical protein
VDPVDDSETRRGGEFERLDDPVAELVPVRLDVVAELVAERVDLVDRLRGRGEGPRLDVTSARGRHHPAAEEPSMDQGEVVVLDGRELKGRGQFRRPAERCGDRVT